MKPRTKSRLYWGLIIVVFAAFVYVCINARQLVVSLAAGAFLVLVFFFAAVAVILYADEMKIFNKWEEEQKKLDEEANQRVQELLRRNEKRD